MGVFSKGAQDEQLADSLCVFKQRGERLVNVRTHYICSAVEFLQDMPSAETAVLSQSVERQKTGSAATATCRRGT